MAVRGNRSRTKNTGKIKGNCNWCGALLANAKEVTTYTLVKPKIKRLFCTKCEKQGVKRMVDWALKEPRCHE